jgi:hypothetical protein
VAFSRDGHEVRFISEHPLGRDWAVHILTSGPPALIEQPPFATEVRLQVSTDGDGLNLREQADRDSAVIEALPQGTVVTVIPDETDTYGLDASSAPDQDEIDAGTVWYDAPWWLHVRTDDGLTGWVAAEFLNWAQ